MIRSKDVPRRAVPKFGSFKSKEPESKLEPPHESAPQNADESKTHLRASKRCRDRESDESPHAKKRRHQRDESKRSRRQHSKHGRTEPERKAKVEKAPSDIVRKERGGIFFIDTKGDPLIRRYGSNDRAQVPHYRRRGRGLLLGSQSVFDIVMNGSFEEFTLRRPRDKGSIFRDKNAVAAASSSRAGVAPKRIRSVAAREEVDMSEADFMPLDVSTKQKGDGPGGGTDDVEPEPHGAEDLPEYRILEDFVGEMDERKANSDALDDGDSLGEGEEDGDTELSSFKRRSIELSRVLHEQPSDTASWLELIGLQGHLLREDLGEGHVMTTEERTGLAKRKLSMYEKALQHARDGLDRERVLIGLMRCGARVWTAAALAKKWDEVMAQEASSFMLWKERVDWALSDMARFSYNDYLGDMFMARIRYLQGLLCEHPEGVMAQKVSDELVYVFLRLTCFQRDAGYCEVAVAAWQMILEITFSDPPPSRLDELKAQFADFWESEEPRMGEEGAKGWGHLKVEGGEADLVGATQSQPEASSASQTAEPRDAFEAWAAAELDAMTAARRPARTMDESSDNDPFRVVLFSDIDDFIVCFPPTAVARVQCQLVDAFLLFCGLPPALLSDPDALILKANHDPFVVGRGAAMEIEAGLGQLFRAVDDAFEAPTKRKPSFMRRGARIALSPDVLFASHSWFRYLSAWSDVYHPQAGQVDRSWVLGVLRHLVLISGMEALAEYYLALDWLHDAAGAKKTAKTLLRRYSNNLRLYNGYARIEWIQGNEELARKVLSVAAAGGQNRGSASDDEQLLWNTWTWMELEAGQTHAALFRLCSSSDAEARRNITISPATPSPSVLLRAEGHFSTVRDYSLSAGFLERALQHAESHVLLAYLKPDREASAPAQGNVTAASQSIDAFSKAMCARGLEASSMHERFLQFAARLLYYQSKHGFSRPSDFRHQTARLMTAFPTNTIFLSLFAYSHTGASALRVDDPVRQVLRPPHTNWSRAFFAIHYELRCGSVHSTEAAFESALGDRGEDDGPRLRGCVPLWWAYIRFLAAAMSKAETSRNGRDVQHAKLENVFHRALAACPGAKELYMVSCTGPMTGLLSTAEKRAVGVTLGANGLRVCVDVDGFVRAWEDREKKRLDEEGAIKRRQGQQDRHWRREKKVDGRSYQAGYGHRSRQPEAPSSAEGSR